MARGGPAGPVQVVRVQHASHLPGQADAGSGHGRGRAAHRSGQIGRGRRGRAHVRELHAVLRTVLRAVLQQPGI